MTVKVTMPNNSSDSVDFINTTGTTLAQVKAYDDGSSNGHLELYTTASGTSAERVRVDSSGNVGIGQTPTAYGSTVRNVEAYIAGASGYTLVSAASASVKTEITSGESALLGQVGTRTNHPLAIKTNDTERMRIDTSGNVGIGTSSPAAPLHVSYTTESGLRLANTSGTPSDWTLQTLNSGILRFYSYTAGAERMRIDSAGQFHTKDGAGNVKAAYEARAWVNFNGTGTVAIRASGNVTSITDNGTGDYTVNFTTAMSDANYAFKGTAGGTSAGAGSGDVVAHSLSSNFSTTSCRIYSCTGNGAAAFDPNTYSAAFFR